MELTVAALYDVHGNLPALEAVLAEVERERPDVVLFGGDLICHATPHSDTELVGPASPEARWEAVLAGTEEHVVVCGHTHLQFDEEHAGHRVVNPGSVGNPSERAAAWWALLGPDVDLRATGYDTRATAEALRATGFPRPDFADELLEPWSRERVLALIEELS